MSSGFKLVTEREEKGDVPFRLPLMLTVDDPDTIAELCRHPEGEYREQFALNALRIGVLALRQARGEIDGEQIRREGEKLLLALQHQFSEHALQVNQRLGGALKEYFDPESGRLHERLNRVLQQDGELETVLRRQIGQQDSELVKTLSAHLGLDSPLMKLLSPDESRGLFNALREMVQEQLQAQQEQVLQEFSLDYKDGALTRLIGELTTNQGKLTENLDLRIQEVVREFSLDAEDSAINRLLRNVDRAQKTITKEFSLDEQGSALSRLKQILETTQQAIDGNLTLDKDTSALSRLRKEMFEILERHSKTNQAFQEEVKITLGQMVARKEEAARSTRHGLAFEEAVSLFLSHECRQSGDLATATGNTTGLIKQCKKGDCVVELGPESAAPSAKIVVEAKEKLQYSLSDARVEIDQARKNRDANVGLFIYSRSIAPPELNQSALLRYGNDVFVIWDAEDPATDLFLRTGLTLARALCVRAAQQTAAQSADFEEIDKAILEIEKRLGGLSTIEESADKIQRSCETILDRVRIDRKSLEKQVGILREKMLDLRQIVSGDTPSA